MDIHTHRFPLSDQRKAGQTFYEVATTEPAYLYYLLSLKGDKAIIEPARSLYLEALEKAPRPSFDKYITWTKYTGELTMVELLQNHPKSYDYWLNKGCSDPKIKETHEELLANIGKLKPHTGKYCQKRGNLTFDEIAARDPNYLLGFWIPQIEHADYVLDALSKVFVRAQIDSADLTTDDVAKTVVPRTKKTIAELLESDPSRVSVYLQSGECPPATKKLVVELLRPHVKTAVFTIGNAKMRGKTVAELEKDEPSLFTWLLEQEEAFAMIHAGKW